MSATWRSKLKRELQELGLWQEFVTKRESYRSNPEVSPADAWLKARDYIRPKLDAAMEAKVEQQFAAVKVPEEGPLEETKGPPKKEPLELPDEFNPSEDMRWVYQQLGRKEAGKKVDRRSAPSQGALALLKWASLNEEDFFGALLKEAAKVKDRQGFEDHGGPLHITLKLLQEESDE